MPRTSTGVRADPAARLARLGQLRPEWKAWFDLLGEVERALQEPVWYSSLKEDELAETSPDSGTAAPLLNGRTLHIDGGRAAGFVRRLVKMASQLEGGTSLRRYRPSTDEAIRLIGAAVRQQRDEIAQVAASRGLHAGALASVVHLVALPLLRACGRTLQERIPGHWPQGYCPLCGAWPILAERRGLDRSRRLRCGRCAVEWEVEWLTCVFCGERGHERLGSLVPEDGGEMLKVETCASCRGYLKSVATLQAIPAFELLLRDLETIELDLVALERGYSRPEERFKLEVEVI